jgi:uncharacterized protein
MIEQDKQSLIRIVLKHLPNAKIFLFGSRARKDNSAESDIDVALDNEGKIDSWIMSQIREDLEESQIPFSVDIVDMNDISQNLKEQILKNRIEWKK